MKSNDSNVKPIKKVMDLRHWDHYLEANGPQKIHAYLILALDTGMLPSVLQALKWSDLKTEEQGDAFKYTEVYFEVKTRVKWDKPRKKIYVSKRTVEELNRLRKANPDDRYIFQSRSPHARKSPRPLTIQRITLELKRTAVASEIISEDEPLGVVTLRKCFGYHHVVHGNWTVHEMMRYLEQRSLKITSRYLDLPEEGVQLGCTPRNRGLRIMKEN